MALFSRDSTFLDPPEAADACERCQDAHAAAECDPEYQEEPERCGCRCHWDAEDYEIEALGLAGHDV